MPLYEYRCENCGHTFDVTHPVGGTSGPCPVCGGPVRRLFSSVGLIFKGSGFYHTDNRKSSSSDGDSAKTAANPPASESSPNRKSSSSDGDAPKTPANPPASESSPSKSSPPSKS